MCWNASISLNTYLFSLFAGTLALHNGVIPLTSWLFMQSWISMQLLEYFIWSKSAPNHLLSMVALVLILSQPVFSMFNLEDKSRIAPLLGAYGLFLVAYFLINPWSSTDFRSVPANNGHLAWHWFTNSIPLILVYLFFFLARDYLNGNYSTLLLYGVVITTTYAMFSKTRTWASMWCWLSNGYAIYLLYQVFCKDICALM